MQLHEMNHKYVVQFSIGLCLFSLFRHLKVPTKYFRPTSSSDNSTLRSSNRISPRQSVHPPLWVVGVCRWAEYELVVLKVGWVLCLGALVFHNCSGRLTSPQNGTSHSTFGL